ncbi:DUF7282 domain-containing protein [Natrialba aegyptia]|uniref:Uncharacterized protein n=1 Tax=Natrialba aegyptia DSM 13077 TaxID=1227491 RepID=M0B8C7_9EURY|nr:CARDB domain-containing protein [Natrialba aegyptia]ELZ06518.1 hypothetical protein C480_09275 [Natrialba aegyptia DSM 13077]
MSSRSTFGTIKRVVAILIAIMIVLAAGIVVGQAPTLFGIEEDPEASIEFTDQQGNGTAVTIDEVSLSDGGFVVITANSDGSESIAVSEPLEAGTHENVTVELADDADRELLGRLTATVHQDTDDDETYTYGESDGEEDRPYLDAGYPVSATATVTADETDDALGDSFVIDSLDVPDTATTNETMNVTVTVRNPTDIRAQQNVELRLDGQLVEWQSVDLDGGETTELTFEVDTRGTPPGEHPLSVQTNRDGTVELVEFEFHTDPGIEVTNATTDRIITDVATPAEGFVAVENDSGEILATSDELDSGEHEEVRISVPENVSVDEDTDLTAVVYEGDPDTPESASPYEEGGDRIETTFTIGTTPGGPTTDAE